MELINVVIDDFNDVSGNFDEDEIDILTTNKEKQSLDKDVTPSVITPIETVSTGSFGTASNVTPKEQTSYETESEDERFDITELVIRDPPSNIQRIIQLETL